MDVMLKLLRGHELFIPDSIKLYFQEQGQSKMTEKKLNEYNNRLREAVTESLTPNPSIERIAKKYAVDATQIEYWRMEVITNPQTFAPKSWFKSKSGSEHSGIPKFRTPEQQAEIDFLKNILEEHGIKVEI
jgi:transposase-like protein